MAYENAKEFIIDNQVTYNEFAKKFNISVDDAIEKFKELDLKKCSKGKNCINSNGPIQSRMSFRNCKSKRDGLQDQCIYCGKQMNQQHHQNNKERHNRRGRQYYYENKEQYKQYAQQYRQKNKKHLRQIMRQHYKNNKEHHKQVIRQHRQNNKEHYKQYQKAYNNSFAKFNTHSEKISQFEKNRRDPSNLDLLQVKCTYCNSWFNPTNRQVRARNESINGQTTLGTENRLYCSNECKQSCPIYNQIYYSKDDPNHSHIGTSREVQPELRQLVFERDNWICQKCSTHKDDLAAGISLHCHHIEGIYWEPLESADTDMCITVCSECHKEIHQIPGCTYQDMQCKPSVGS